MPKDPGSIPGTSTQVITPVQALIRTVLLVLVITAVTFDDDGRGIYERLSGSVLTRGK